jgi:hypothetical protein
MPLEKRRPLFWWRSRQDCGGQCSFTFAAFFPNGVRFVAHSRLSRNNVVFVKQSTAARGYGGRHQKLRKQLAVLVASGRAVCWRCGKPIQPWMAWDLGHDDYDRSIWRGVECRRCNRSCAASRGNRMRGKRRRSTIPTDDRLRVMDTSRDW